MRRRVASPDCAGPIHRHDPHRGEANRRAARRRGGTARARIVPDQGDEARMVVAPYYRRAHVSCCRRRVQGGSTRPATYDFSWISLPSSLSGRARHGTRSRMPTTGASSRSRARRRPCRTRACRWRDTTRRTSAGRDGRGWGRDQLTRARTTRCEDLVSRGEKGDVTDVKKASLVRRWTADYGLATSNQAVPMLAARGIDQVPGGCAGTTGTTRSQLRRRPGSTCHRDRPRSRPWHF